MELVSTYKIIILGLILDFFLILKFLWFFNEFYSY